MDKRENITNNILSSVRRFAKRLRLMGIPIRHVILFGSWSKGKQNKDSDIDVALVSPKFGKDEVDELQFLLKQTRDIDDRLEPIPLSLSDYQSDATPMVVEIKKHGLILST